MKSDTNTPLSTYLHEVSKYPLLTKAKEKELANKISQGCLESRELLIKCNLRLVVSIAKRLSFKRYNLADLIEDGNMGLIRAVELYDSSFDTKFSTYATFWIKQSIKRGQHSVNRLVRLPAYMSDLIGKWNKTKSKLWTLNNKEPTDDEIIKELGIKKKQAKLIKAAHFGTEIGIVDPETGEEYINSVPDREQEHPFNHEEIATLMTHVDKLPPREHDIICMRFGIGHNPMTLGEIGDLIGLTRERIRQIEVKAIDRLKYMFGRSRAS